jgi:hypothetical protein
MVRGFVGAAVGPDRVPCDRYGDVLTAARMAGDHFRTQHNTILGEWASVLQPAMEHMQQEPLDLFSGLLSAADRARFLGLEAQARHRQGILPDLFGRHRFNPRRPRMKCEFIADVKTLHFGRTVYPPRMAPRLHGAVKQKARATVAEYRRKVEALDRDFCGVQDGGVGPIARKYAEVGTVIPLVHGHFAEMNEAAGVLLQRAADFIAASLLPLSPFPDRRDQKPGYVKFLLARQLTFCVYHSMCQLLASRLTSLRPSGQANQERGAFSRAERRRRQAAYADAVHQDFACHFADYPQQQWQRA